MTSNSQKVMAAAAPSLARIMGARERLRRKYPGKVLVKTGAGTPYERIHEGELGDVMTWTAKEQGERVTAAGLGCEPDHVRVLPRHALLEIREIEAKVKRLYKRRTRIIRDAWCGSSLLDMETARRITSEREKLEGLKRNR